jgi:hypothetical protein
MHDCPDVYAGKFESRDYCGLDDSGQVGIENDQEWYQLDFWASGTDVDVYYSIDEGQNWIFVEKKTLFTLVHGFETAMSVFNSYF